MKRTMFGKILGKIYAYIGNLTAIAGIVWMIPELMFIGIFILVVGCIIHEVSEK